MLGKFLSSSLHTWIFLGWLLLTVGGIVTTNEEDDEVIEVEPPAALALPNVFTPMDPS